MAATDGILIDADGYVRLDAGGNALITNEGKCPECACGGSDPCCGTPGVFGSFPVIDGSRRATFTGTMSGTQATTGWYFSPPQGNSIADPVSVEFSFAAAAAPVPVASDCGQGAVISLGVGYFFDGSNTPRSWRPFSGPLYASSVADTWSVASAEPALYIEEPGAVLASVNVTNTNGVFQTPSGTFLLTSPGFNVNAFAFQAVFRVQSYTSRNSGFLSSSQAATWEVTVQVSRNGAYRVYVDVGVFGRTLTSIGGSFVSVTPTFSGQTVSAISVNANLRAFFRGQGSLPFGIPDQNDTLVFQAQISTNVVGCPSPNPVSLSSLAESFA